MLIQKIIIQDSTFYPKHILFIQDDGEFIELSKDNSNCFEVLLSHTDNLTFKILYFNDNDYKLEKIETIQNYIYKPNLKFDLIYSETREEFYIDLAE